MMNFFRKCQKGFTLLEAFIVMLIVGLLLSIVFCGIKDTSKTRNASTSTVASSTVETTSENNKVNPVIVFLNELSKPSTYHSEGSNNGGFFADHDSDDNDSYSDNNSWDNDNDSDDGGGWGSSWGSFSSGDSGGWGSSSSGGDSGGWGGGDSGGDSGGW